MLRVIMLNVVMLSAIMLNVVMLSVIMLSVSLLNVVMLSVETPPWPNRDCENTLPFKNYKSSQPGLNQSTWLSPNDHKDTRVDIKADRKTQT